MYIHATMCEDSRCAHSVDACTRRILFSSGADTHVCPYAYAFIFTYKRLALCIRTYVDTSVHIIYMSGHFCHFCKFTYLRKYLFVQTEIVLFFTYVCFLLTFYVLFLPIVYMDVHCSACIQIYVYMYICIYMHGYISYAFYVLCYIRTVKREQKVRDLNAFV